MARQLDLPLHVIPENFVIDAGVISHLKKLKAELMPDLIETHAVKSHAVLRASGLWRETPWIAFHHGYTRTAFHSPLYNRIDRWSLPAAARVVTMNRDFQRQLVQHGVREERITVLHNAVQLPACHSGPGGIGLAAKQEQDRHCFRRESDFVRGASFPREGSYRHCRRDAATEKDAAG